MNEAGKFDGRCIAQRTTNKKGVHTQACTQHTLGTDCEVHDASS